MILVNRHSLLQPIMLVEETKKKAKEHLSTPSHQGSMNVTQKSFRPFIPYMKEVGRNHSKDVNTYKDKRLIDNSSVWDAIISK